jgi:hypothetical protein
MSKEENKANKLNELNKIKNQISGEMKIKLAMEIPSKPKPNTATTVSTTSDK